MKTSTYNLWTGKYMRDNIEYFIANDTLDDPRDFFPPGTTDIKMVARFSVSGDIHLLQDCYKG